MPISPENRARYPADWKLRSRFVRFVRARGRCEWCGVPHGALIYRAPPDRRAWLSVDPETGETLESSPLWDRLVEESGGDWYEGEGVAVKAVLTTAHVYDMRPEAASLLNLAALCQLCHNRHDAAYRRENRARRAAEGRWSCS